MKVINRRSKSIVSREAELKTSFLGRFRGLILSGRRDIVLASPADSMKASTIHMLGVLYPIDVIWVDSAKKVVDLKENVLPFNPLKPETWRIYKPKKPAKYVVELSVGEIRNTKVGDTLDFE